IPVRRQRDALLARRQARQVARLLGFDAAEQACIAGLVFELAAQALTQAARVCLTDLPQMDGPWAAAATPAAEVTHRKERLHRFSRTTRRRLPAARSLSPPPPGDLQAGKSQQAGEDRQGGPEMPPAAPPHFAGERLRRPD